MNCHAGLIPLLIDQQRLSQIQRAGSIMSVDTLAADRTEQHLHGGEERLPPLTAGIVVIGLALLCWVPLLLPIIAFFHR
jgi:hypothetical protein